MPSASDIPDKSIQISIDRGGTFTDTHVSYPKPGGKEDEREELVVKLLSQDPAYDDAPREAVRRVLEKLFGKEIKREEKLSTRKIDYIRLSTTVATNALLERKGARHALLITKGFRDLLLIGNQSRPKIFDLAINKPAVLYDRVVEIDERVTLVGYTNDPKAEERGVKFDEEGNVERGYDGEGGEGIVRGMSGEAVRVLQKPDEGQVRKEIEKLKTDGFESLAVVLMHSYTFPEHERMIGKIAEDVGFEHVSLSSSLMPMIKIVARGTSSTADAYLTPVLKRYIDGFFNGFDDSLRKGVEALENAEASSSSAPSSSSSSDRPTRVEFMRSDGGLTDVANFSGLHSILSGPAGGVVGCALTSWDEEDGAPVIGLDVGGTSADVSRFDGRYETVFETTTAGVTVQSPQLDINTVAAGGGSRLFWRNGLFVTGPESAGAQPGPACYRKGGPLAVTDANLLLGRLVPDHFPKIFGPNEDEGLDEEATRKAFEELAREINADAGKEMSLDEIAWGFLKIANETMCRPIRSLTEARGYSTSKHVLAIFGGAGGQHACALAATLGITRVLIHRYSSILSAYGMALSDRVVEKQEPSSEKFSHESKRRLMKKLGGLEEEARKGLKSQGFADARIKVEKYLNLRYDGTDTALMTLQEDAGDFDFAKAFEKSYKQEFGFVLEGRDLICDDVRVRGIGKSFDSLGKSVWQEGKETTFKPIAKSEEDRRDRVMSVYFDGHGRLDIPVFLLGKLQKGDVVEGPALIIDDTQTLVIDPGSKANILERHVFIEMPGGDDAAPAKNT